MNESTRSLKDILQEYTNRSTALALALFLSDLLLLLTFAALAVIVEEIWLKLLLSILAGDRISALFVIGHDAAHGAYTDQKWLNQLIGRIAFLPALHNYSLWQIAHNAKHHRHPNLKNLNSWSPLSKQEYDRLNTMAKAIQRFYRTLLGLGPYYIANRWLPDKLFPRKSVVKNSSSIYWIDFMFILGFVILVIGGLSIAGSRLDNSSPMEAIVWGFVIPFISWNYIMGLAIYLQHTNIKVPWFSSEEQWQHLKGQHEVTVHVVFPGWFNFSNHNIMLHTAHHVHPKVPFYRLNAAQQALTEKLGDQLVSDKFSISWLFKTMQQCKLYDYENLRWLHYDGSASSETYIQKQNPMEIRDKTRLGDNSKIDTRLASCVEETSLAKRDIIS